MRRASGRLARENMGRDLLHVGGACEEHVRGAGMAGSCPEASELLVHRRPHDWVLEHQAAITREHMSRNQVISGS